ncbi:hypothetical protein [Gemmata sp.]|uniref:hypothetical protein n=1 Tax=Gemmata sp. TaxID=1914242 RepID=UPI003F70BAEC
MGWEQRGSGSYYYTAERVGGRVVKRYVGTGRVAELCAQLEAATSAQTAATAERHRQERDELAALDAHLDPLDELADTLVAAALVAAGFHRHHRGPWRKRRA